MLTLTFLGVGSAFAKRSLNSNVLLEAWAAGLGCQDEPDATLLIDLGGSGPQALHELKSRPGFEYLDHDGVVDYRKIGHVFVTHLHSDHIGGLEELALMSTFTYATRHRPLLLSTPEILGDLWEHSLRGGLGIYGRRPATLEDYFAVQPLTVGQGAEAFAWAPGQELEPFRTDHLRMIEKYDWPSLGLVLRDVQLGASAFFSGDSRLDVEAYGARMADASICFHEVHLGAEGSPVHTPLELLLELPAEIRRKTHLYHYGDDWDSGAYGVVSEEFAGFVRPLERYVLSS